MTNRVQTAHVLISQRCCNNCIFCAVREKRNRKQFLNPQQIYDFISNARKEGVRNLVFSGLGEPTLDDNFENYLDFAASLDFDKITLFTNGYNLTREKAGRWKRSGLSNVLLSVHGLGNSHDRNVRRKGSYNEAMFALRTYLQNDIAVDVNTCVTGYNIASLAKLVLNLKKYGIRRHLLSFPEWKGLRDPSQTANLTYAQLADWSVKHSRILDDRIVFDNIPFCLVHHKVREMGKTHNVRYIDGGLDGILSGCEGNIFPEICYKCTLHESCCGFDRGYIDYYGWDYPARKAADFIAGEYSQRNTILQTSRSRRTANTHNYLRTDRHLLVADYEVLSLIMKSKTIINSLRKSELSRFTLLIRPPHIDNTSNGTFDLDLTAIKLFQNIRVLLNNDNRIPDFAKGLANTGHFLWASLSVNHNHDDKEFSEQWSTIQAFQKRDLLSALRIKINPQWQLDVKLLFVYLRNLHLNLGGNIPFYILQQNSDTNEKSLQLSGRSAMNTALIADLFTHWKNEPDRPLWYPFEDVNDNTVNTTSTVFPRLFSLSVSDKNQLLIDAPGSTRQLIWGGFPYFCARKLNSLVDKAAVMDTGDLLTLYNIL